MDMDWFYVDLLLFAACLMELAAQSSKGIYKEIPRRPEELPPLRSAINLHFIASLIIFLVS